IYPYILSFKIELTFCLCRPIRIKAAAPTISLPATVHLYVPLVDAVPASAGGPIVDEQRSGVALPPCPQNLVLSDRRLQFPSALAQVASKVCQHTVTNSQSIFHKKPLVCRILYRTKLALSCSLLLSFIIVARA